MSLRLSVFCLLTLLLGCSTADQETAAPLDEASGPVGQLTVEGELTMTMLPNAARELAVRYRDAQGAYAVGAQVDFALMGAAPGASLSPSRAVTDAQGLARTRLRAGGTPGELAVRASAGDAAPVYVKVSVAAAPPATLSASVRYDGTRSLASYSVTALEGFDCASALDEVAAGEVVHTFQSKSEVVRFDLKSGLTTAVVAWGRDQTGAKLARGCASFEPAAINPSASLVVTLENTSLVWDGELALQLELDVSEPTRRLAETASAAVEAALGASGGTPTFAEADYLLAPLTALVRTAPLTAAALLALATDLHPLLERRAIGPRAFGRHVGDVLKRAGAGLTVEAGYDVASGLRAIERVNALAQDGVHVLRLAMLPAGTLTATLDSDGARLQVDQLRIQLGLGEYGRALWTAVQEDPKVPSDSERETASGCRTVVGPWLAARPELAAEADRSQLAVSACEQAIDALLGAIASSFAALDTSHAALQLSGVVQVQDRSEDGRIDDLGPASVEGSWGVSAVRGELRVPVQTALSF